MQVAITPVDPNGSTRQFQLWGDAALTGGVGGWEVLDRPRRLAATEWVSQPAHTLTLTLVLSGVDALGQGRDRTVEADLAVLRSWGKSPGNGAPPPRLALSGPVELPAPWTLWVMQDIVAADDPAPMRTGYGVLMQQAMTLTLLEWTGAQILLGPAAAARARAGKS